MAKEAELMWKSIEDLRKQSMRKCCAKAGGGPDNPSNHSDFESRDPENFA